MSVTIVIWVDQLDNDNEVHFHFQIPYQSEWRCYYRDNHTPKRAWWGSQPCCTMLNWEGHLEELRYAEKLLVLVTSFSRMIFCCSGRPQTLLKKSITYWILHVKLAQDKSSILFSKDIRTWHKEEMKRSLYSEHYAGEPFVKIFSSSDLCWQSKTHDIWMEKDSRPEGETTFGDRKRNNDRSWQAVLQAIFVYIIASFDFT